MKKTTIAYGENIFDIDTNITRKMSGLFWIGWTFAIDNGEKEPFARSFGRSLVMESSECKQLTQETLNELLDHALNNKKITQYADHLEL